jgi:hypothetical protein
MSTNTGDDFVAFAHTGDAQADFERRGAGIERAHRAAAAELGQRRLEPLVLRAGRDPTGAEHVGDALNRFFIDLRFDKRQKRDC